MLTSCRQMVWRAREEAKGTDRSPIDANQSWNLGRFQKGTRNIWDGGVCGCVIDKDEIQCRRWEERSRALGRGRERVCRAQKAIYIPCWKVYVPMGP